MDLKEQDLLGAEGAGHWYDVAKGRALRALLAGRTVPELLDVGAGSGVFMSRWSAGGPKLLLWTAGGAYSWCTTNRAKPRPARAMPIVLTK